MGQGKSKWESIILSILIYVIPCHQRVHRKFEEGHKYPLEICIHPLRYPLMFYGTNFVAKDLPNAGLPKMPFKRVNDSNAHIYHGIDIRQVRFI